ncbi:hypothetical protein CLAFUW4_10591 [Fulvia fulva]|uniref:Uncharacterized protein n=1 Tax=Passalora fulva TaxID=5499 RepID=A0A9Q8LFD1_PASFU|nr:uncharacterized protein CLAFUR5_05205 [Fulvia fulva]KAK4616019.1 hypothetical protein CLAFUR4_10596 [Fulvia fulva]KAK4617294.1 hypothetical protein CLAFUR0_10648 [Fulvia fulva]UJO16406.1 hypothetical protein CLAFUR5_05205 [Fulvia fulva]WPV18814.1 hypothetical protein CLAFUW4_10591 [Fulvia fulva]WPV34632.1 hypothetical protein CLAFUW7_10593 [Fulvia fulva]
MQLQVFLVALASIASALPVLDSNPNAIVAREASPEPRLVYNGRDPLNLYQWQNARNYRPWGQQRGPIFRQLDQSGRNTNVYYDPYNTRGGGVRVGRKPNGDAYIINGGTECVEFDQDGNCEAAVAK